jgi:hypothetical protein
MPREMASSRASERPHLSLLGAAIGRPRDVHYCQDCGGANAATASSCRICGHLLADDRSAALCQSCGAATAEGANFCSLCGTATVAAPTASLATVLPGSLKFDAAVAAERQAAATRIGSVTNLGEGLDLPDWLKRAASEQPFDPSRPTAVVANPYGPAGSSATLIAAAPTTGANSVSSADAELASRPPLSIPDSEPRATAPAGQIQPERQQVGTVAALKTDVADTKSFISEDDLPEWIRQLAAADAAKNAEELRRAADAVVATQQTSAADPRSRRPLPGETAPTGPATSPWLTRRERASGPETVAPDTWGASSALAAATDTQSNAPEAGAEAMVEPEVASGPMAAELQTLPQAGKAASKPSQMRLVLIAAVVLLAVALLAFMALS